VKKRKKKKLLAAALDIVATGLAYFVNLISKVAPMEITGTLCGVLAAAISFLIPETYLMGKNLRRAFPEKDFWERLKIILGVWFNLGLFAGEYCYIHALTKERLEKMASFSKPSKQFLENFEKGRGSLILSGHFFNWELALAYFSKLVKTKMNVVYRRSNNNFLERLLIQKFKRKLGIELIAKADNAGIRIVRALKMGEIVTLMVDQKDKKNGVLVDLFGQKAYTNTTAFDLYKKLDIDLYYFSFFHGKNIFKININAEKLDFDRQNITRDDFLRAVNAKLEADMRERPSQWFWVHNRWETGKGI
jgi:KDO2-lipid IV(A) lauroyltransferase